MRWTGGHANRNRCPTVVYGKTGCAQAQHPYKDPGQLLPPLITSRLLLLSLHCAPDLQTMVTYMYILVA